MLLFENNTDMPYEVAATAWTQSSAARRSTTDWDALRAFRDRFVDKGPELIPYRARLAERGEDDEGREEPGPGEARREPEALAAQRP